MLPVLLHSLWNLLAACHSLSSWYLAGKLRQSLEMKRLPSSVPLPMYRSKRTTSTRQEPMNPMTTATLLGWPLREFRPCTSSSKTMGTNDTTCGACPIQ